MVRPTKDPATTVRGKKKLKAEMKAKARLEKAKSKDERKALWKERLCKAPDGSVMTFQEVGKFGASAGTKAWENAPPEEQEHRKEQGRAAFSKANSAKKQSIINAGKNAWEKATSIQQDMRAQHGRHAYSKSPKTDGAAALPKEDWTQEWTLLCDFSKSETRWNIKRWY